MTANTSLKIGIALLFCFMLTPGVDGQTRLPGPPQEGDERLITPLINAGIALNENSLIEALKHQDTNVAARAARALGRLPKSNAIVSALKAAISQDRDIVSLSAGYSLLDLNQKTWVPTIGVSRLAKMHDPLLQIQFAGLLAQGGSGAGWSIITSRITDELYTPLVLESIDHFEGKTDQAGRQIRVVAELERLSREAPEASRRLIAQKLAQLKG